MSVRTVLTSPRWWYGHLGVLGLCVGFVFLGRWQWDESQAPGGDFQNFAYAIQWWLFILVAIAWYTKIIRDHLKGVGQVVTTAGNGAHGAPERLVTGDKQLLVTSGATGGQTASGAASSPPVGEGAPEPDDELAEWNAWLAALNSKPRRR